MIVKKSGKIILGADLTVAERKALEIEIRKQIAESEKQFELDMDSMVLWTLHEKLGLGAKRLKEFYKAIKQGHDELTKYYMIEDYPWICRRGLEEIGVNIEEWDKEIMV